MNLYNYHLILKKDRLRYGKYNHFKLYVTNDGYKIITHYRRCSFLYNKKYLYILYMIERLIYRRTCVKYGCDIPSHVVIGPGMKIDHPFGIVINSDTIIGENLTIKSGAVIGKKDSRGPAVIKDNVLIGVHAIILGNITIGNNVDIGAGAIVTHDVPDNAVVMSDSSKIHRIKDMI